ncbi:hypothetical protein A2U01_0067514, partial [Trifolium medium]|nr:hypothetical protein [Trifolium medium]
DGFQSCFRLGVFTGSSEVVGELLAQVLPAGDGLVGQASVLGHGSFYQCGREDPTLNSASHPMIVEYGLDVINVHVGVSEPVVLPQLWWLFEPLREWHTHDLAGEG